MEQQTHILQTSQPMPQVTKWLSVLNVIQTRTNLWMPLMWCTTRQHIWDPLSQPILYMSECYLSLTLEWMHIQSKDWGFSVGKIVDTSLLIMNKIFIRVPKITKIVMATIWVCQSAICTLWVLHILREVGA